jgi:spore coat polysaccharide biosynthesis protein SpsF (cytidylyltransferase family)
MSLLKNADIVMPSVQSANGHASVGFSSTAEVFQLLSSKLKKKNENTEMMWGYFNKNLGLKIKILPDMQKSAPKKLRLTLDYPEDYIFLDIIRKHLGNFVVRKKILSFLKNNKHLIKINYSFY